MNLKPQLRHLKNHHKYDDSFKILWYGESELERGQLKLDLLEDMNSSLPEGVKVMAIYLWSHTKTQSHWNWEVDLMEGSQCSSPIHYSNEHCTKHTGRPRLLICESPHGTLAVMHKLTLSHNFGPNTPLYKTLCWRRLRNLTGSHSRATEIEGSLQRTRHRCHRYSVLLGHHSLHAIALMGTCDWHHPRRSPRPKDCYIKSQHWMEQKTRTHIKWKNLNVVFHMSTKPKCEKCSQTGHMKAKCLEKGGSVEGQYPERYEGKRDLQVCWLCCNNAHQS